jgi:putative SOS response-associated peptidase YedK
MITIDAVVDHQFVPMRWVLIPGWWGKPLKEMRMWHTRLQACFLATSTDLRTVFNNHMRPE